MITSPRLRLILTTSLRFFNCEFYGIAAPGNPALALDAIFCAGADASLLPSFCGRAANRAGIARHGSAIKNPPVCHAAHHTFAFTPEAFSRRRPESRIDCSSVSSVMRGRMARTDSPSFSATSSAILAQMLRDGFTALRHCIGVTDLLIQRCRCRAARLPFRHLLKKFGARRRND